MNRLDRICLMVKGEEEEARVRGGQEVRSGTNRGEQQSFKSRSHQVTYYPERGASMGVKKKLFRP